ncbi:DegQ family serine endoprotease [Marinobacterium sediminicola]|uniref:Probable periplasmic serine endoprotease DegP-like n=1 Tax=Marinobacterium sediminicola TaxID=518898 RepID=A0ABY1RZS9_9GAMM|nr:DegQ family serine endoprotease [Marinobacterium sediminicola]ULG69914.1 DegQ family serine endoprotease [Marinobacterium sediminicola]SMR74363.1 serine protease Do [Marinobacterium sediminicola]
MKAIKINLFLVFACLLTPLVNAAALPDFTELVEDASPAVVNISTVQKQDSQALSTPFGQFHGPNGEEIPEIFRHFFREIPQFRDRPHRAPRSLGSGFIISHDGYILTNHHVIKDADQVMVRLNDRRELEAEVVGSDERTDVALLKIDADDLPVVRLGRSSQLKVGEWVLAIGSPFGFDHSVTAGIVSATERALANENYVPFIQTDVAINPGNSGGPLFNLKGEVVGINSQIYTRSGGFMGLSFAIPIDVALEVSEQLKGQGFVERGWLGVLIQEVNRDLAESFGLKKPAGALVAKVMPDSPAAAAGIQEGDIILSFNDHDVVLSSDLPPLVGRIKPGDTAEVEVIREGRRKTLDVTIGRLPNDEEGQPPIQKPPVETSRLGVVVAPLPEELKDKWNVRSGVIVERVEEGAGARAGLVRGDVITMLNGERVETLDQFQRIVSELPGGRSVPLRVVRRGNPMFIALKPE